MIRKEQPSRRHGNTKKTWAQKLADTAIESPGEWIATDEPTKSTEVALFYRTLGQTLAEGTYQDGTLYVRYFGPYGTRSR